MHTMASFLPKYFLALKTPNAESFGEKYFDPFKKETGVIEVVLIKISYLLRHTYILTRKHSFSTWKKKMSQEEGD